MSAPADIPLQFGQAGTTHSPNENRAYMEIIGPWKNITYHIRGYPIIELESLA